MSRKSIACLIIILILAALVFAGCGGKKLTGERGNLAGTITYNDTEAVDNAKVSMSGEGLATRSAFSGANGQYLISKVAVGTYSVTADFSTATNLPEGWEYYWGYTSLNGDPWELASGTITGAFPNYVLSLGDVVIADDTTTTLDFNLYGY